MSAVLLSYDSSTKSVNQRNSNAMLTTLWHVTKQDKNCYNNNNNKNINLKSNIHKVFSRLLFITLI